MLSGHKNMKCAHPRGIQTSLQKSQRLGKKENIDVTGPKWLYRSSSGVGRGIILHPWIICSLRYASRIHTEVEFSMKSPEQNQIRPPTIVRILSIAFQTDGQTASLEIFLVKGKVVFL